MFRPWESEHSVVAEEQPLVLVIRDEEEGREPLQQQQQLEDFVSTPPQSPSRPPVHSAASSTGGRRGAPLRRQSQEIVHRVYEYCTKQVAEQDRPSREKALKLTSEATQVPVTTLKRYIDKGVSDTPGKKRPTRKAPLSKVDEFTMSMIKRIIYQMYAGGRSPNIHELLSEVKKETEGTDYSFPYEKSVLVKILKKLGFKWKKASKNRKVLMEKYYLKQWRAKYLRSLEDARASGTPIFYLDETWYNTGDAVPKIWTDDTVEAQQSKAPIGKGERLIILHCGGELGWVPNALLLKRTRGCGSADYHKDMNSVVFEEWFRSQLLPNLPAGSAVVMDNASYHSRKRQKKPTKSSTKSEMCQWLDDNNIPHPELKSILKVNLFNIVQRQAITDVYEIEELAREAGHTIIRLPPYHCHLNPIELAWGMMKPKVRKQVTTYKAPECVQIIVEHYVSHYCRTFCQSLL